MRRGAVFIIATLVTACREGSSTFSIDDPFEGIEAGQLTFNVKNDHTPFWNEAGDSVYYGAESFPSFPVTRGLLLSVPRSGGLARPILPSVQLGAERQPWLSAPVVSPDGNSIAFFELTDVRDREFDQVLCPPPAPPAGQFDTLGTNSFLQQAVLRVRSIDSNSVADAGRITVNFAGRTAGPVAGFIINVAHPFQRLFEAEGVPIFRASWSPDGTRLVFSDGTQLRLWTVGQATSTPIAGTDDGIMPAWSPDGNWIAFSKPFRGSTQHFTCFGINNGVVNPPAAQFDRTVYTPLTRENAQLMLIRPDGTGLRSLGEGDAPTWTPDSRSVIAHRERSLFSIAIESSAASAIANTLHGFEPAITRDGRFLTFARRVEIGTGEDEPLSKGNYDIWVVSF